MSSLSDVLTRSFASTSAAIALMTQKEKIQAGLIVVSMVFNGLLQISVIVAVVGLASWAMGRTPMLPPILEDFALAIFGSTSTEVLIWPAAASVVALVLAKEIFSWLQVAWMARFSADCEIRLSSTLMRRVLHAPYGWLVRQNTGRLRQLIFGFVTVWSRDFIRSAMRLLNDAIVAGFIIAGLIWSNPAVGIVIGVLASLVAAANFLLVRPKLRRLAEIKRQGILGANSVSTEALFGVKDVKMGGAEDWFTDLFDGHVSKYAMADSDAQQWIQLPRLVLDFLAYGALVAVGVYVALAQVQDTDLAAMLLLYGLAAQRLLPVFSTVVSGLTTLVGSLPIILDIKRLIDETATVEAGLNPSQQAWNWSRLETKDVSLQYEGSDRSAISDVTLTIERGKSYGIVGRSGSGKSTFIDVLSGLIEPSSGSILIDGELLGNENRRRWRSHFGYVSQRPFLLDTSLTGNILFGSKEPLDIEKLEHVISMARLDQVVARLPGGRKGRTGEQGNFLSGGERQRVVIARALYRGVKFLVLDEATSALDTIVEREIAESLERLRGNVTTVVVSHRLGLVRNCDEILLFDEGRLVDRGPHEQLEETSELYRRMIEQGRALEVA